MTNQGKIERECGECSACCITLKINEPELTKRADDPCPHLRECGGCGIYPQRPQVCRTWLCGWKSINGLDDGLRPDRCGVLIRDGAGGGLTLQPLRDPEQTLLAVAVLTLIASAISSGIPLLISVPTRPGYCYALVALNQPLAQAIQSHDIVLARSVLLQLIRSGQRTKTDPVDAA